MLSRRHLSARGFISKPPWYKNPRMETPETEVVQPSTRERLDEIFEAFRNKGARGAVEKKTYLFQLTGESGLSFLLTTNNGQASIEQGYQGEADVTLTLSAEDLIAMADGELDGRQAVASEKIAIDGDLLVAEALLGAIEPEEA